MPLKTKKRYYTGVGSRRVPQAVLNQLRSYAKQLDRYDYVVRTGEAAGCDSAFASQRNSIIYEAAHTIHKYDHWSYKMVKQCMPNDRHDFDSWRPYVKALLARNMMQVLGDYGTDPSEFLVCWAPSTHYADSSSGGTGWAIRCALLNNVPVYNIYSAVDKARFEEDLGSICKG